MADDSGSVAIVAILVIVILVLIVGFFLFRDRIFGPDSVIVQRETRTEIRETPGEPVVVPSPDVNVNVRTETGNATG